MGIKKFFKIKPPEEDTPEMNREQLNELGIPTKNVRRTKKEKFAAYGHFAKDKAEDRFYAPPGYENSAKNNADLDDLNKSEMDTENKADPYLKAPDKSSFDPYARNNVQDRRQEQNPYSTSGPAGYASNNPYEKSSSDPYARTTSTSNPYEQQRSTSNPYGQQQSDFNSYGQQRSNVNPYGQHQSENNRSGSQQPPSRTNIPPGQGRSANPYASLGDDPYSSSSRSNSYSTASRQSPVSSSRVPQYGNPQSESRTATISSPQGPQGKSRIATAGATDASFDFENPSKSDNNDEIDLNATLQDEEEDFNSPMNVGYENDVYQRQQLQQQTTPQQDYLQDTSNDRGFQTFEDIQRENEQRQQQEEDEAVDEIKQQIRFTKQSSVASTRNTLKMAQEAEMAGTNTLGMLGHQSEKLNAVERNLDLMRMQNRVADDKVAELKKLNRNILAVHMSNPFNSKRRLREAEERIRTQRIEDKLIQKQTNGRLMQSTNRIESAMNASGQDPHDSVKQRYQNQAILERSKRYQFENDAEDDEMELEIDKNLDKVGQISGRLKRLAIASGDEIDAQQNRIANIEEDTDNMDIKIHLNTTRLTQIR
ncbi:LAFA_0E17040g1_1 [Lachancea sp. 'fantastica']|nr:LAFA_0E17040g1_1 [Lachancea sp. 'fantastica']